ncbi:MAG: phosphoribosyl-AMP cyclohydrolase [Armatimonadetes bacterium]|nr:phosphoribosyl-AMP cyclohydrolase [Armatimonadota bacterium]
MKTKDLRRKVNLTFIVAIIATMLTLGITSCKKTSQNKQNETDVQFLTEVSITEQEVSDVQKAWGEGIVKIGKVYLENGDYKTAALNHINEFYGYEQGTVLFKPTLTSQKQFRTDLQGALSYFVSGNDNYPEDHGFAIKPWSSVRWENIGTKIIGNMAVAMGNYYFTPANGDDEVKVEYSFAYSKDESSKLRIILHDSHLPYTPVEKH